MFECDTCSDFYWTQEAVNQHMDEESHWECETCSRNFGSLAAVRQHMNALGHWAKRYPCQTCNLEFLNESAADEHMSVYGHWEQPSYYCEDCDRIFQNENNLNQHLRSKIHMGNSIQCPFCQQGHTTASGVAHHLETGSCPNAPRVNRETLFKYIREKDQSGIITKKLLEWSPQDNAETVATSATWDGGCYRCYLCGNGFAKLTALNQHLRSPRHKQRIYHCFGRGCGREFTALAALFNHLESESCGATRFDVVQRNVAAFGSGRMLTF